MSDPLQPPPLPRYPQPAPQPAPPSAPIAAPVGQQPQRVGAPTPMSAPQPGRPAATGGRRIGASLVVSVLALVLAVAALGVSTVGAMRGPTGCDVARIWATHPDAGDLPSGWRYDGLDAYAFGSSGSIVRAAASDTFSPSVYFNLACSSQAAAMFQASVDAGEVASRGSTIGFKSVGDEVRATKTDDGSVEVLFRRGDTLVTINGYGAEVSLSVYEDLALAIDDVLTGRDGD